jgi:serine/threonine protein kinase
MKFCRQCGNSLEGVFCPLCQRPNRLNVKFCTHCGAQMAVQSIPDPFATGKLPIGLVLNGKYVITRKIAQGGMGAVYEAKEVPVSPTSRRLAIKEMSFSMLNHLQETQQKAVVESFHREYDLLSKLNHPNLVRI